MRAGGLYRYATRCWLTYLGACGYKPLSPKKGQAVQIAAHAKKIMVHVTPPTAQIIRPPLAFVTPRLAFLLGGIWLASLLLCAAIVHSGSMPANVASISDQSQLQDSLQQRITVLERSEQIVKVANADLQQTIREREEEIAGLRADLAFYNRLTGGNTKREGLAIQGLQLSAVNNLSAYNFIVTLTQNLKKGQMINGHLSLSIEGVKDGKLQTMGWSNLGHAAQSAGLEFGFKYFQRINGTLMLPEGFVPNRITVVADASGDGGHANHQYNWAQILNRGDSIDVQ